MQYKDVEILALSRPRASSTHGRVMAVPLQDKIGTIHNKRPAIKSNKRTNVHLIYQLDFNSKVQGLDCYCCVHSVRL